MNDQPTARISPIKRAINLIELLSYAPMGVREIARKTAFDKSAVSRTLNELEEVGVVCRTGDGKFQLTYKMLSIGNRSMSYYDLFTKSDMPAKKLNMMTRNPVAVSVLINDIPTIIRNMRMYTDYSPESGKTTYTFPGYRLPIHSTASGKIFLSFSSDEQRDRLLASISFDRMAQNTIMSKEVLINELEQIKKQGYSVNHEEFRAGTSSVAAPIFNYRHELVGCISIIITGDNRNETYIEEIAKLVISTVKEISYELSGY